MLVKLADTAAALGPLPADAVPSPAPTVAVASAADAAAVQAIFFRSWLCLYSG